MKKPSDKPTISPLYEDSHYMFVHGKFQELERVKSKQKYLSGPEIEELFGKEFRDWEHYFVSSRDPSLVLLRKPKQPNK